MRIEILTLFPELFAPLHASILGRAEESGLVRIRETDVRAFSKNKHKKCDDYPFGGGAGMVMTPQPVADAVKAVDPGHELHRIYLSPRGRTLDQSVVAELAKKEGLLLLCGHYEGMDQRVIDLYMDEELSIGDYVLTGGELAAMVLADSVCRCVPGVLAEHATEEESFSDALLEYPQYTRPEVFEGVAVPGVLLSGHHGNVEKWRMEQRIALTKARRPELLARSAAARAYLEREAKLAARRAKKRRKKEEDGPTC